MAENHYTIEFTEDELATEEWRPIVGFEDTYSVSSLGRVRRDAPSIFGPKTNYRHMLKSKPGKYPRVSLSINGQITDFYIHDLVCRAFIGEKPTGQEVNHKDGIKTNNRATNLEYLIPRLNKIHNIEVLGNGRGIKVPTSKLADADVIRMRQLYAQGYKVSQIATEYPQVNPQYLHGVIHGKRWKHLPFAVPPRFRRR